MFGAGLALKVPRGNASSPALPCQASDASPVVGHLRTAGMGSGASPIKRRLWTAALGKEDEASPGGVPADLVLQQLSPRTMFWPALDASASGSNQLLQAVCLNMHPAQCAAATA